MDYLRQLGFEIAVREWMPDGCVAVQDGPRWLVYCSGSGWHTVERERRSSGDAPTDAGGSSVRDGKLCHFYLISKAKIWIAMLADGEFAPIDDTEV